MRRFHPRQSPDVRKGRVQKKNGHLPHQQDYYLWQQREVMIDRQRPGDGYRHLLTVADLRRFLALLPNWPEISVGLNAVVLARGGGRYDGWHRRGIVAVCAWERTLWTENDPDYVEQHKALLERLGVPMEPVHDTENGKPWIRCQWTEEAARAFQLLHILLHELGHHHDRITTRRGQRADRGEFYAENYAWQYEGVIWERYWQEFEG